MIAKLLLSIIVSLAQHLGGAGAFEQPGVEPAAVSNQPDEPVVTPTASRQAIETTTAAVGGVEAAIARPSWSQAPIKVAAGLSADEIVQKIQNFYRNTQRLTAKFRQTYTNKTFGKSERSDGMVYIKKPGKMRWDYRRGRKTRKSFISDGKVLWAVMHHQKQYVKQDLRDNMLPVAISFLYGKGDLSRDFNAKLGNTRKYGGRGDLVVVLTPKKRSAQYKTLTLVVDSGDFRVKQSIVEEASGNINHFRFFEPDTKRAVKDTWFYFNENAVKGKYRKIVPGKNRKR